MSDTRLYQKTRAALWLSMLGDAAGAPFEGMHWREIDEACGTTRSVRKLVYAETFPPDSPKRRGRPRWTDDTCYLFLNGKAIIRKGGRISAHDLPDVWHDEVQHVPEGYGVQMLAPSALTVREKLRYYFKKKERWMPQSPALDLRDLGRGARTSVVGALGIAPVAIVNACHPRNAAQDAYDVAGFLQEGHVRDGAACYAAALAEAFRPEATIEGVVRAAQEHGGRKYADQIDKAAQLAAKYDDVFACREAFDRELRMPLFADPLELIPVALAYVVVAKGDPAESIAGAAHFGQDCDGIALFAGGLTGALHGDGSLDGSLLDLARAVAREFHASISKRTHPLTSPRSLARPWDFDEMARDLTAVAEQVLRTHDENASTLRALL